MCVCVGGGGRGVVVEGKSILYVSICNEYVYLNSKKKKYNDQLKYKAWFIALRSTSLNKDTSLSEW